MPDGIVVTTADVLSQVHENHLIENVLAEIIRTPAVLRVRWTITEALSAS
ncbi:hypothetical protein [Cutibacterium sp. V947]